MLLITALLAMILTMVMLPPLSALARRVGLIAYPDARKVHESAIPQAGGVAIVVTALIGASVLMPATPSYLAFLTGAGIVFVLGLFDDYHDLGYRSKFAAQFTAAAIAVAGAGFTSVAFGDPIGALPMWMSLPIAIVLLVETTNAVNLADGLDGLAGGLVLLSGLGLAICGYETGNDFAVIVPLIIVGSVVGFLRFNTHPARLFMGDNGAYFLGFALGFAALSLCASRAGETSATAVAMLLGVPVLDAAFVPIYRFAQGRRMFLPDRSHLHHRLVDSGFSHRSAVALIYAFHSVLVLAGFGLRSLPEWVLMPAFAGLAALIESAPWLLSPLRNALKGHAVKVRPSAWLDQGLAIAAFVALLASTIASTLQALAITVDFVACAVVALIVTAWWHLRRSGADLGWPERVGLYVLGAYTIYFQAVNRVSGDLPWDALPFGVVGLFFVFRLVANSSRTFALTPLDALVVLATAAVAVVSESAFEASTLDIVKLVIWFYAIEWLAAEPRHGRWLRALSYSGLGLIAARGIIGLYV